MSRKYQQIKAYSKIMKLKKQTGEIQQISPSKYLTQNQQHHMQDQQYKQQPLQDDNEFEDQFQDQFQEEQAWLSDSDDDDGSHDNQEQNDIVGGQQKKKGMHSMAEEGKNEHSQNSKAQVFMGTKKNLKKGQILDFDNSAYDMLHRLNIEWPSLSIDFICKGSPFEKQTTGFKKMDKYPYEVYTVQGSSNNTPKNSIYLTKWCKLHKTKYDDDPQVEGDSQDEDIANDQEPELIVQQVQTTYNVNRIRSLVNSPIVAFWNDQGELHIMDLTKNYEKLKNNIATKKSQHAKEIVLQSEAEGYALSWSKHSIGQLLAGNTIGNVEIYTNNQSYSSWAKTATYLYHKGSVQDIVVSPNEPQVFATCSTDGTLQIVDMRVGDYKKSQLLIKAHSKDVNVCDWSVSSPNLIVTGSDDCLVKVWDLRRQKNKNSSISEELINFNWHTESITSIKFQPNDESVIAVASEDNSISIWDMAMQNQLQDAQVPNELMFIHQGQEQIKELVFHPIYYEMIVSSALDGINIFKPSYQMPQQQMDAKQDLKRPPIHEKDLDNYLQIMRKKAQ